MSTKLSQKEYLKKYLSNSDKKSKKKKNKSISGQSVKIIDDDIDLSKLHQIADEDLEVYAIGEDAPTIVGVVDDRPPELIAKEDYKNSVKWKVISNDDGFTSSLNVQRTDRDGNVSRSNDSTRTTKKYEDDDDLSPPRTKRRKTDEECVGREEKRRGQLEKRSEKLRKSRFTDASPPRRRKNSSSSDNSPPRRNDRKTSTAGSQRKIKEEPHSDNSPPNKNNGFKARVHSDSDQSPQRIRNFSSASQPKRRVKEEPDSDASPPRRRNYERSDSDQSPPRKSKVKRERDSSPLRKRTRSPPRKYSRSPRRRRSRSSKSTNRRDHSERNRTAHSSSIRDGRDSRSPLNRRLSPIRNLRGRNSPVERTNTKMTKTLDGKAAGLQNAQSLKIENEMFKKREEDVFSKMSAETSGRNAEAVVRDRKTGRIRDLREEAAKEYEKLAKEQERKNLYDKWGKGLKQIEDYRSRLESDVHEMNKPLARYSDDKDLEDMLKKQERDGDPMLNYIRNKKESAAEATPSKPIYRGAYPENRFGIRPGYRWDGVDRSNGYETKWFDVQSKRKAGEEEAYKYSTEDM